MSQKQREANRRNAQRSTGPKSREGKARSSQNSFKHGLCAKAGVLPGEDPEPLARRLRDWSSELQPRGQVARYIVEEAVYASIRLDRCRKAEAAEISKRMLQAVEAEELEQSEAVDRLAATLAENPGPVARRLALTVTGCHWLLERLEHLHDTLDNRGWLEPSERDRFLHLCGRRLDDVFRDPFVYDVVEASIVCGSVTGGRTAAVQTVLGLTPPEKDVEVWEFRRRVADLAESVHTGDTVAARRLLATRIDQELARVARLARGLAPTEAALRASAPLRAACDTTPEGQARHRYEEAHRRALRYALRDLERIQKLVVDTAEEDTAESPTAPTPAPAPTSPQGELGLTSDALPAPADVALAAPEAVTDPAPVDAEPAAAPAARNEAKPRRKRAARVARPAGSAYRGPRGRALPDALHADGHAAVVAPAADFEAYFREQADGPAPPVPDPVFRVAGETVIHPPDSLGVPAWYRPDEPRPRA